MLKIMYSFIDILKYMKIPLIVGILLSVAAAMIGVVLVLKRYSMIGDGLSHVGFGAVAIGLACGIQPLYIAIPFVIISAYVLLRLGESKKVNAELNVEKGQTLDLVFNLDKYSLFDKVNGANIKPFKE